MATRLGDWMDQRSGWRDSWNRLFLARIPRVSWGHTLGAATLVSVIVLMITGILLTVYYVSSPSDAHQSVQYITNVVPLGWLIRGLHHWAASALVVLAIAHLVRVILHGAYKYPREFTWFTGIALLLLIFAFGLTGSLLPWDQRAYWATQVRIEIFATVPVIGDWLARLIQGGEELSGLTLSRFYAAHVWLFPMILVGLIVVHLRLVGRHGISAAPRDERRSRERASHS
ncbi:MAG: cytochrome b N-terminal domain-containing protein [Actinomycetota bacterium]|nr:cytochrome b N-terminal domain-containing protein [Actinomycetota bacterium]